MLAIILSFVSLSVNGEGEYEEKVGKDNRKNGWGGGKSLTCLPFPK
jgi:hypothetical protein